MKRFNVTGLCIPEKHYMADISEKVERIVSDYIERGEYFTINRARQYGKTTMLSALQRRLSDRYLVIRLSFEGVDDGNFNDNESFVDMFVKNVGKKLRQTKVNAEIVDEWLSVRQKEDAFSTNKAFDILSEKITCLCSSVDRGVILLVDEVDKSSDNQIFLNFLGMLRNKYLDMQEQMDTSFQSVILAGVYDIKNLKLKIRSDEERKYNSPWNIAADFDVDMSLSECEISGMLQEYCAETGIGMDIKAVSEKIRFYTNGYPFLVSWLCKWIDERGKKEWTTQSVENAEKALLKSHNTLFDDLMKNIGNYSELKQAVTAILFYGEKIPFSQINPAINLGVMFGILVERNGLMAVSNIIFETLLYDSIIIEKTVERFSFGYENNEFIRNGCLDMERALLKFQEVMRTEYRSEDEKFIERQGRLLFLCFMKPIINGKGNYYVEPETRSNTRMDIVISYGGSEYIVELKIWRGQQYRQEALLQIEGYLESRNCRKGYLVSFSFHKDKEYTHNMIVLENSGREVYEVVV